MILQRGVVEQPPILGRNDHPGVMGQLIRLSGIVAADEQRLFVVLQVHHVTHRTGAAHGRQQRVQQR